VTAEFRAVHVRVRDLGIDLCRRNDVSKNNATRREAHPLSILAPHEPVVVVLVMIILLTVAVLVLVPVGAIILILSCSSAGGV